MYISVVAVGVGRACLYLPLRRGIGAVRINERGQHAQAFVVWACCVPFRFWEEDCGNGMDARGSGRGNLPGLFRGSSGVYVLAPHRMVTASLELGSMFR